MNDIAIRIEHLSKVYKIFTRPIDRLKESLNPFKKRYSHDFFALDDVSFTVGKGETIGIIGKNGAGKSTLLKIITGVLTPTGGKCEVAGRIASLLELGAGFNPEMTGIENIYLNGTIMGYSKEDMDARLDDIVAFADIGDFIASPVKLYSSGMFARLAFAVNAYVEPDILIVDEALSVGDAAFQAKCITRMRHMMESGVTILFVTHDMTVVKNFCQRCVYLEKGKVRLIGEAEEIADIYLREIRDEMNESHKDAAASGKWATFAAEKAKDAFRRDDEFRRRTAQFRQGDGRIEICAVDIWDMKNRPLETAQFNQPVRIRIYLEFHADAQAGVGYHIRDDRNVELIGTFTSLESEKLLTGQKGDRFIVEFVTRLPLVQGAYNVTLVVSAPLDDAYETAVFYELIENAYLFSVESRKPSRIWNKVYIPVDYAVKFVGTAKERKRCACCGEYVDDFLPIDPYFYDNMKKYGAEEWRDEMVNRRHYGCPKCGASDRERAYAIYMSRELPKDEKFFLLDIAPAPALQKFIKRTFPHADYRTGDLMMPNVDYKLDVTDMREIASGSVDFFVCSHVLEHVSDDLKAMRELKRILKPKTGRGILVVPLNLNRTETDEDPAVTDAGERWRRFGQDDHVRAYARADYLARLSAAGFTTTEIQKDYFGADAMRENDLIDTSTVYIVSAE